MEICIFKKWISLSEKKTPLGQIGKKLRPSQNMWTLTLRIVVRLNYLSFCKYFINGKVDCPIMISELEKNPNSFAWNPKKASTMELHFTILLDKNRLPIKSCILYIVSCYPPISIANKGGFQLQDLIITELKSHMTCYNSIPLIGWNYNIQTREQISTNALKELEFLAGHVTFKLLYNQI